MNKCVVSGCPNRRKGPLNRVQKRFYQFPKDQARVKVWLAALRETEKQDSTEQHVLCEDHFLPQHITAGGIREDAIPIMSPYLDGVLGTDTPWAEESSEEDAQWAEDGVEEDAPLPSKVRKMHIDSFSAWSTPLYHLRLLFTAITTMSHFV